MNFAPELSLSGSLGKSLKSSRSIERKDSYEVTASVTVPIFNKGHNFLNLEKSKNSAFASFKSLESKKLDVTFPQRYQGFSYAKLFIWHTCQNR